MRNKGMPHSGVLTGEIDPRAALISNGKMALSAAAIVVSDRS